MRKPSSDKPRSAEAGKINSPRHDPRFELIRAEINRPDSFNGDSYVTDWEIVADLSTALLKEKGPDLLIGAFLGVGLVQVSGLLGLLESLRVLTEMCAEHWLDMEPPAERISGRESIMAWWENKTTADLSGRWETLAGRPLEQLFQAQLIEGLDSLESVLLKNSPDWGRRFWTLRNLLGRLKVKGEEAANLSDDELGHDFGDDFDKELLALPAACVRRPVSKGRRLFIGVGAIALMLGLYHWSQNTVLPWLNYGQPLDRLITWRPSPNGASAESWSSETPVAAVLVDESGYRPALTLSSNEFIVPGGWGPRGDLGAMAIQPCPAAGSAGSGIVGAAWNEGYLASGHWRLVVPIEGTIGSITARHDLNPKAPVTAIDVIGLYRPQRTRLIAEPGGPVGKIVLGLHHGFMRLGINYQTSAVPSQVSVVVGCSLVKATNGLNGSGALIVDLSFDVSREELALQTRPGLGPTSGQGDLSRPSKREIDGA
ncbi:MAG: type VI secretion system ImpA family N-terminal domain-containing protein [Deltaproteobacteria bacterium]|nr:type VI secretion system ImpA family N-terminal domain-containing protein [Deltaproteobacteria bacterium]